MAFGNLPNEDNALDGTCYFNGSYRKRQRPQWSIRSTRSMPISHLTGVLCTGNICFDMPVWPVPKMAWGTTTWVERIETSIGGNGANTSFAMGRLGVPVRLNGVVGSDERGSELLGILKSANVDTGRVRTVDAPTTMTICVVHPSGDRLFLHKVGTSTEMTVDEVRFEDLGGISHFHFANPFSMPNVRERSSDLMRRAREAGLTTSLDTGWDSRGRWIEDIGPALPFTDLLFVNESEGKMLSGLEEPASAVEMLRRSGASDVIVKLGERGCLVFSGSSVLAVEAFRIQAVDSTGAGDCFAGGFLAALNRGDSYADAARFANAVGALSVQELGAVRGVLGYEETLAWMSQRSKLEDPS